MLADRYPPIEDSLFKGKKSMIGVIENYRPLDYTKTVFSYGTQKWAAPSGGCLALCKKVGGIALTTLLILPAILLDLLLMAVSSARRFIYSSPLRIEVPPQASPALLRRILSHPYKIGHFPKSSSDFLRDALKDAFGFLDPQTKFIYQDLIKGGGEPAEGEATLDIFKWSAACLLVHRLRFCTVYPEHRCRYYPEDPPKTPFGDWLLEFSNSYARLTEEQKGLALLKLLTPESSWEVSESVKQFIYEAEGIALEITRRQEYNTQIYPQAVKNIENL